MCSTSVPWDILIQHPSMKIKTALPKSPCPGRLDFCPGFWATFCYLFDAFPTGDDHYLCFATSGVTVLVTLTPTSALPTSPALTSLSLICSSSAQSYKERPVFLQSTIPLSHIGLSFSKEHRWGLLLLCSQSTSPEPIWELVLRNRDSFLTLVMDPLLCGCSLTFHANCAQNWVETSVVLEEVAVLCYRVLFLWSHPEIAHPRQAC